MIGILLGLSAALVWATSSTLMRSQTARYGAVPANFWRCVVNIPFFILLYFLTQPRDEVLHLAPSTLVFIVLGVIMGIVTGDSIQYHSIKLIGVSRAMPIAGCFPIFTVFFAWLINGEPLRLGMLVGSVVVVMGVLVISLPKRVTTAPAVPVAKRSPAAVGIIATPMPVAADRTLLVGVCLSMTAAICWSLSTVVQSKALQGVNPITMNMLRMPLATVALFTATRGKAGLPMKRYGWKSFGYLALIGWFGTGLGSLTYLAALKTAGAGKTAVLGACAPLFGLPLSMILLGERPGWRGFAGTALTVCGIVLVVTS